MLKFTSLTDSQLFSRSALPPPYRQAVSNALHNLCSILGPDLTDRGFVVFVEENDTLTRSVLVILVPASKEPSWMATV